MSSDRRACPVFGWSRAFGGRAEAAMSAYGIAVYVAFLAVFAYRIGWVEGLVATGQLHRAADQDGLQTGSRWRARIDAVSGSTGATQVDELVSAVRGGLVARADSAAAPVMRRYMKSTMPFRGVTKPGRVAMLRELRPFLADPTVVEAVAHALWDRAEFREERYVAISLARKLSPEPGQLRTYRGWIVSGAWWDYVDEIASHLIGPILRAAPTEVTPIITGWTTEADRWVRRASIICQLGSKERTDTSLLAAAIEASINDADFFLRKAIGWALRQYARTDPAWVSVFVASHPDLSSLSRREASKRQ